MTKKKTHLHFPGPLLLIGRSRPDSSLPHRFNIRRVLERQTIMGYLLSIPLVGVSLLVPFLEQSLAGHHYFLGTALLVATLVSSLFFGTGPALFSILLATVILAYFFLHPVGGLSLHTWSDLLTVLPFFFTALVIAFLTSQREAALRRTLGAEQAALEHAQKLAQANHQLEEANRLKDQFLSIASHELRTPISIISGYTELMQMSLSTEQEFTKWQHMLQTGLENIENQAAHLSSLTDTLLDMSSFRAGKLTLQTSRCDLGELCSMVAADQRLLSGRAIEITLPLSPVVLEADGNRLYQVIINLVSNAIKYAREESPVQVHVCQQAASAMIQVHNVGPVIAYEQQEQLFEPFYRSPSAKSSHAQGWGLGLAICKDIVERHRGRIWVESSEESGTTFVVKLPLDADGNEKELM